MGEAVRIGLVTSVGRTLDGFFPQIVSRLSSQGFVVTSASGSHSDLPDWTPLAGFTQRPSPALVSAVRALRAWSRTHQHDVVVTNTATASAIVRLAGLSAPVVYFCHGLHWGRESDPRALPWRIVERGLLRRTAGVITINSDDQAWFERHHAPHVHRLPGGVGVPLADFPRSAVPDAAELRLVWIGDFTPRKRPEQALAVVEHLVGAGVPVTLRMLGDGPLIDTVREQIRARGLADVVRADGRASAAAALAEASALLHTATWEGLPRVALEAAAVGRWTYGFDVKGLRDAPLVRLAPDGDAAALARRIADDVAAGTVRSVPDVRDRLGVDAAADGIAAALLDVLGRPAPASAGPVLPDAG
ncbi:glycosyltransferase [Blastococcus sp. URHD0036]|uniref:glycosyltransferase n=1 Tax=Blastococcus sp. URHD0036 TaxID=1380356 RepID=UPI00049597A9|nr:glycosyltransferase [Blastococcus sp. URHD0036]